MEQSISEEVVRRVNRTKRGTIFFVDSFAAYGNAKAVGKALERLVKAGKLYRVATGMYIRPIISKVTGKAIMPSIDEIALAIAKRDKAKVLPSGVYAQYKLGLTTQVPMNVVYHTDASARKLRIGQRVVTFRNTSARNLTYKGPISSLAIQALKDMGQGKVDEEVLRTLHQRLEQEDPKLLKHDLKLAPAWIQKLLGTPKFTKP